MEDRVKELQKQAELITEGHGEVWYEARSDGSVIYGHSKTKEGAETLLPSKQLPGSTYFTIPVLVLTTDDINGIGVDFNYYDITVRS